MKKTFEVIDDFYTKLGSSLLASGGALETGKLADEALSKIVSLTRRSPERPSPEVVISYTRNPSLVISGLSENKVELVGLIRIAPSDAADLTVSFRAISATDDLPDIKLPLRGNRLVLFDPKKMQPETGSFPEGSNQENFQVLTYR